jgi:hypothetical protein
MDATHTPTTDHGSAGGTWQGLGSLPYKGHVGTLRLLPSTFIGDSTMFTTSTRIALAVAAAAVMGVAQAGTDSVAITADASALRPVTLSQGDLVVGTYQMSDGRKLVLKQRGRALSADLDNVPLTRLMASGTSSFRSADDGMRLSFVVNPATDTTDITVTLRADGGAPVALASLSPATR